MSVSQVLDIGLLSRLGMAARADVGTEPGNVAPGGALAGGTTGQTLVKASNADGDYEWGTPAGGGGGSIDDILAVQVLL